VGAQALFLVVGWFALVGAAVPAMAIAMYVNDDPNASAAGAVFMTALGAAFLTLALWILRPLLQAQPGRPPAHDQRARAAP
jgi:uncharacterized membrane protein YvlD (DUF360 family)